MRINWSDVYLGLADLIEVDMPIGKEVGTAKDADYFGYRLGVLGQILIGLCREPEMENGKFGIDFDGFLIL